MTRLVTRPRPFPGWIKGLIQDADLDVVPLGSIVEGLNFVPTAAGRQQTRGGTRVMLTLHADGGGAAMPVSFLEDFDDPDGTALTAHTADTPSGAVWSLGNELLVTGTATLELDTRDSLQGLYVRFTGNYFSPTIHRSNATITYVAGQDIAMLVNFRSSGAGTYYSNGTMWGIRFCRDAVTPDDEYLYLTVGVDAQGATDATVFVTFGNSVGDSGMSYADDVVIPNGLTLIGATLGASLDTVDLWYATSADFNTHIPITTLTVTTPGALTGLLSNTTIAIDYPGTYFSVPTTELQLGLLEVFVRGPSGAGDVEISQVPLIVPFTPTGAVAIGWSHATAAHYAYRLSADAEFFTGVESTSRTDLTAAPSTSWNNTGTAARPVAAELFEKLFIADATVDQPSRNEFLSLDSTGVVVRPTFAFAGGSVSALTPYCLEEYNGVLFLAGYGDEGDMDRPEIIRHSFLARSPDAADGFDQDAYLLLGAKGQRVTALRKGRGLLLAAKENEFYRITGFGRAYPGWQYQVENIQNTTGLGVSNPLALTFAEGFWYGVGAQGPFRTDGYTVESLVGPRQRAWRAITEVDHATVAYHPERRVIVFGVVPPIDLQVFPSYGGVYPWTQWLWDIERSVWQTDWRLDGSREFWMVSAVPTTSAVGPAAVPFGPNTTAVTVSGYTANWSNGDGSAQTEVWEKTESGGTWTLITTVDAGISSYARIDRASHTEYFWKVRHRKSGVTSEYTTELSVQTIIGTPVLSGHVPQPFLPAGQRLLDVAADVDTTTTLQRSPIGAGTWTTIGSGLNMTNRVVPAGFDYRAQGSDAAWTPTTGAFSVALTVT